MALTRADLRPDQVEAIDWLKYRTEALLIYPVGFGKTVITLTALEEIKRYVSSGSSPLRTLVVSTKNIVNHTWPGEIRQWGHLSHLSYQSAAGRKDAAVLARPDVLGINFESLEWFYDLVDRDPSLLPELLVIDESSKMKSHQAKRVRRHCGFFIKGRPRSAGYVHHFRRRFALSATPNPEGYAGLWSQEACVSKRRRLGANITAFRDNFCHTHWNGITNVYTVTRDGEKRVEDALRPITHIPETQTYLELEEPIHTKIEVAWSDLAREEYDELEAEFVLDIRDKIETIGKDRGLDIHTPAELEAAGLAYALAPNMGVLLSKLRQACSGFVYDADGNARTLEDPEVKLRATRDFVDRTGGAPLVVFHQFRAEANALGDYFPEAVVGLPDSLDAWDAGDVPMLVLHPRSAGHGINLQRGGHLALWYSLPYSFEEWWQANGRLHRTGQRHRVSIARFERPGSVEQDVWAKLGAKEMTLSRFIGRVGNR